MKFTGFNLLVVYLCNNWKLVVALQEFIMAILAPFIGAAESRKQAAEAAAKEQAAAARKARLARLKAQAAPERERCEKSESCARGGGGR